MKIYIDLNYTSQLPAKTVIIVLTPKLIKQCEQCLKSVAIHNSEERTFKPGLNRFKQKNMYELIEPTFETAICFLGTEGTIPYVLIPRQSSSKQIHHIKLWHHPQPNQRLAVLTSYFFFISLQVR